MHAGMHLTCSHLVVRAKVEVEGATDDEAADRKGGRHGEAAAERRDDRSEQDRHRDGEALDEVVEGCLSTMASMHACMHAESRDPTLTTLSRCLSTNEMRSPVAALVRIVTMAIGCRLVASLRWLVPLYMHVQPAKREAKR